MIITLKDGSSKEYAGQMAIIDIAKDISEGLARVACAAEVNGEVKDLRTVIDADCELNILTAADPKGLAVYRHTAAHVMAEAVKRLFPEAKLTIGPSIDNGFYYDFDHAAFSRDDLDKIEAEMKKIIKEGKALERFTLGRDEAIKFMEERNEDYKVELINEKHVKKLTPLERDFADLLQDHGLREGDSFSPDIMSDRMRDELLNGGYIYMERAGVYKVFSDPRME